MIRSVVTTPSLVGECPLWSEDEQVLWWVDIEGRLIHRYDPATDTNESRAVPGRPGSLALTAQPGRLLVSMEQQLVWFEWSSGDITSFVDLTTPSPARLNDGRTDPAGRFVVGAMQADLRSPGQQQLHQVEADGTSRQLRDGILITNGIAFDAARNRMYFADTLTDQVMVYDYDAATGRCDNERLFIDYSDLPGKPDGACVDAEGYYWSASIFGWAVTRFTPDGEVDRRIDVPIKMPSMPAFGGPDLRTLYVTTIGGEEGTSGPEGGSRDGFVPGSLLAIDLDDSAEIRGLVDPPFAAS